jgi:hypothetical protein
MLIEKAVLSPVYRPLPLLPRAFTLLCSVLTYNSPHSYTRCAHKNVTSGSRDYAVDMAASYGLENGGARVRALQGQEFSPHLRDRFS